MTKYLKLKCRLTERNWRCAKRVQGVRKVHKSKLQQQQFLIFLLITFFAEHFNLKWFKWLRVCACLCVSLTLGDKIFGSIPCLRKFSMYQSIFSPNNLSLSLSVSLSLSLSSSFTGLIHYVSSPCLSLSPNKWFDVLSVV